MNIAEALKDSAHAEVVDEAAGMVWRIQKVTNVDLLNAGARHLIANLPKPDTTGDQPGEPDPVERIEEMKAVMGEATFWCVASVVAARKADAEAFEAIRIVREEAEEDTSAQPPRLWIERLPMKTRGSILAAAQHITMEKEGLTQVVNSFRGGSKPAPARGRAGKKVRKNAP